MFLFEKSVIGAHLHRLYDLKERHGPFLCYGRTKANSAGKDLNVTNINTKAGPSNRQIGQTVNSSCLYLSKRSLFGRHHQF